MRMNLERQTLTRGGLAVSEVTSLVCRRAGRRGAGGGAERLRLDSKAARRRLNCVLFGFFCLFVFVF